MAQLKPSISHPGGIQTFVNDSYVYSNVAGAAPSSTGMGRKNGILCLLKKSKKNDGERKPEQLWYMKYVKGAGAFLTPDFATPKQDPYQTAHHSSAHTRQQHQTKHSNRNTPPNGKPLHNLNYPRARTSTPTLPLHLISPVAQ